MICRAFFTESELTLFPAQALVPESKGREPSRSFPLCERTKKGLHQREGSGQQHCGYRGVEDEPYFTRVGFSMRPRPRPSGWSHGSVPEGEDVEAAMESTKGIMENAPFGIRMTTELFNVSLDIPGLRRHTEMENRP